MNQFTNELEAFVSPVSSLMKTDFCSGIPVMVFNPVEVQRRGAVTVRLEDLQSAYVRVYDEKGREVKSQTSTLSDGTLELVFVADVESLGTRIYDVRLSDKPCCVKSDISINHDNMMENQKYIVTLNRKGNISSILDKELDEKEILKEPITLGLFNYTGSKDWPAWEMNYKEANKDADRIPNVVTVTVLEQGPARVSFKVIQQDKKSTFTNIVALTDGCDIVEVYSEIEWQSLRTLAKNKFSFTCENDKATFDLGLGAIERGNMTENLFEVPAQKWVDLTDKSGEFGVSVLSECKYGWDKYKDNTLRLTAIHTPKKNYRIDSMQSFMDLGLNRYSYAIFSHKGKAQSATQLEARKFVTPMTAYIATKHQGKLKTQYSFGEVSTNDVIIRAIKKAENSDEIVVRLNEGTNSEIENFTLTLGEGIKSAREIYASEENKGDATVKDGKLITSFKPYEYTIPNTLVPDEIMANGVRFDINKSNKNSLICSSQRIKLDKDKNRLVFLCASMAGDKMAEFILGDKKINKNVLSSFERFAAWDLYDFGETAYMKKGKIGYDFTHCLKNGEVQYAKIMYFYLVEFDLYGENEITLPNDNDIVILAASQTNAPFAKLATPTYDEVEKRPFTFKLNLKEKLQYVYNKCVWQLGDKDNFIKDNNKGKDY